MSPFHHYAVVDLFLYAFAHSLKTSLSSGLPAALHALELYNGAPIGADKTANKTAAAAAADKTTNKTAADADKTTAAERVGGRSAHRASRSIVGAHIKREGQ